MLRAGEGAGRVQSPRVQGHLRILVLSVTQGSASLAVLSPPLFGPDSDDSALAGG